MLTAVDVATNAATITFVPPLVADYANNDVVTFSMDNHVANLAYHRNAFALAVAPLSDMVPGGQAFTATDPNSGLSVRASMQWLLSTKKLTVSLDILYGVQCLDLNMAVRAREPSKARGLGRAPCTYGDDANHSKGHGLPRRRRSERQ